LSCVFTVLDEDDDARADALSEDSDGMGSLDDYQVDMSEYPDIPVDELLAAFGLEAAGYDSPVSSSASELSDYEVDMSHYPDVSVVDVLGEDVEYVIEDDVGSDVSDDDDDDIDDDDKKLSNDDEDDDGDDDESRISLGEVSLAPGPASSGVAAPAREDSDSDSDLSDDMMS